MRGTKCEVRGAGCAVDAEETVRLYDEILRLTLEQREAIGSGDMERLLSLLARRGTLMASLPAEQVGEWQQTRRQQIAELDRASGAFLHAWREQVVAELGLLQRGQTGLRGYRAHPPVDTAFIDGTS